MAIIDRLLDDIIKKEGGYSNRRADKGGPTNFGITITTFCRNIKDATLEDLKEMSVDTAKYIYKKEYYFRPNINSLPLSLQPVVFDMAVNSGPEKSIKLLQKALVERGFVVGEIDGIIGKRTISAAEQAACAGLINAIVDKRIDFYHRLCASNPSQREFLKGWLNRAESFRVKQ